MKSIWTKTYERKSRHGMFCHTKDIEIPVSCAGAVRFPSGSTKVICCWAGEVTAPETEGKTAALRR